jgi:hypothetical protein
VRKAHSTLNARNQLSVRVVYDAIAALRRNGTLPAPVSKGALATRDFVAVRIAPPSADRAAAPHSVVCHVRIGQALITCQQWPPAAWLATLGQVSRDVATPEH